MPPRPLNALTALRFFAALWVVLFDYWPDLSPAAPPPLLARGYLGVELFFVLSGFILCHVYLEAWGEGRFSLRDFLAARFARIYPLHLITLALVGVMALAALGLGVSIDPHVADLRALPANLLLMQAWGLAPTAAWNHPSWSISAEWFAYLAFPAFAALAWRLRHRPQQAVACALALLIVAYPLFGRLAGFSLTQATVAWGALRIVPPFVFGGAVYLAWRAGAVARPALARAGAVISVAAIAVFGSTGGGEASMVAAFGLLVLGLAGLSDGRGLLNARLPVWLGEISYAMYMLCIPWRLAYTHVARVVLKPGPAHLPPVAWVGVVVTLIALSGGVHHLVERPARAHLRRWLTRPRVARLADA